MKRGFTLIELLIVIAIIAILALIAVPNFLEAQVRAKVSRALADMRSLAVAVEAYSVDWGRPPVDNVEYDRLGLPNVNDQTQQRALTTPVSFISKPPADVFVEAGHTWKNGSVRVAWKPYRLRNYVNHIDVPTAELEIAGRGYVWMCRSLGPSRSSVDPDDPTKGVNEKDILLGKSQKVYDATNGTMSFGLIMMSNKGLIQGNLLTE